jgi:hypothetical protein
MDEFPSNSRNPQEPKNEAEGKELPQKFERVVEGNIIRRKTPLGKRFAETFFGGASFGSVVEHLVFDVLVVAAKDLVADTIQEGINRTLYGEGGRPGRRVWNNGSSPTRTSNGTQTNYQRISKPIGPGRDEPRMSRRARAMHDFDEIIFATRVEGDQVLDRMYMALEKYEVVHVADLYEMVGEPVHSQDYKYGWTSLRGAHVVRTRAGFLLDLPLPEEL